MIELRATALTILELLEDNEVHSSNELVDTLRISRTSIWKQIHSLNEMGYKIDSIRSKGYQLNMPGGVLLEAKIEFYLNHLCMGSESSNINIFPQLESTNEFLKDIKLSYKNSEICLAEQQTNGRGRFKRVWYSPFAENIYLSIKKQLNISFAQMSGFSLCISLAIIDGLIEAGYDRDDFAIKWPNDVLHKDKKLAGILIELTAQLGDRAEAIIGIGLNVNMQQSGVAISNINRPWTSLSIIDNCLDNDRNFIAAHLIASIRRAIKKFEEKGFNAFRAAWQKRDVMFAKKVNLTFHERSISGTCQGIDNNGNILIEQSDGTVDAYSSGEVSFHK